MRAKGIFFYMEVLNALNNKSGNLIVAGFIFVN